MIIEETKEEVKESLEELDVLKPDSEDKKRIEKKTFIKERREKELIKECSTNPDKKKMKLNNNSQVNDTAMEIL